MYDVIVVGARCAGASTAMLLSRAGYRVLLVDRAAFPRDTMSTLFIQQRGVGYLRRWGVLGDVAASGCPPLSHLSYRIGEVRLAGPLPAVDGGHTAFAPRRQVLDPILVAAAVAAGVEFRDRCAFQEVVFDGDRAVGVRLRTPGGGRSVERARLVVGADGMRSAVAAAVGAETLVEDPRKTCVYYTFWPGVSDHFELYEASGQWVGAVPTNDGATLVQAYFPQSDYQRVRHGAMAAYLHNVRTVAPDLSERMAAAGPVDTIRGTGDQQNFFRACAGPGWALVGDAGHCKDSITARGITHAFVQAQLLADSIGEHLHDEVRLRAALDRFAAQRYREFVDDYRDTLSVARLSSPPHRVGMLARIAEDPARTNDFFAAMSGAPRPDRVPAAASLSRTIGWIKQTRRARAAAALAE